MAEVFHPLHLVRIRLFRIQKRLHIEIASQTPGVAHLTRYDHRLNFLDMNLLANKAMLQVFDILLTDFQYVPGGTDMQLLISKAWVSEKGT